MVAVLAAASLVAGVDEMEARCRWVWQGVNSHWICDEEDMPRPDSIFICEFLSDRSARGKPRTLTVFCRPDGSIWKEVVVRPRVVVVRTFRPDGTLAGKRKFRTDEMTTPPARRARHVRPVPREAPWIGKQFETRIMGVKLKGTVERRRDDIRGVVYVYRLFGKKDTYHFQGKIEGTSVVASHTSGHVFRGKIIPGRKVTGVLTTSSGIRIPLNVPMALP